MSYVFYFVIILFLVLWVETPFTVHSNSLITRKESGENLEHWLRQFNWGGRIGPSASIMLPEYKFYSGVINILLELSRKMGGTYQESLIFLRESLQGDMQFEKKMVETLRGVYLQMGMMMILTWSFIFAALKLVDLEIELKKLLMIFLWQISGVGILPFLLKFFRKKYFSDIGQLWKILLILKSLSKVPLSRTEVLTYAGVQELKSIKQPSLEMIVSKLKEVCHKTLKFGTSYDEDLRYLMEELRFVEKWHYELFEKRLMVIKLVLLSVFFLPSYLVFIFFLLEDLKLLM
jgi:transposase